MEHQMHKPEPDLLKVWRFVWAVCFIASILALIILMIIVIPPLAALLIFIGLLLVMVPVLIYLVAFYKTLEYSLEENAVLLKKGVFWRKRSTLPYAKITNIDITQGPVERLYNTGKLHIQTAGYSQQQNAELVLPGIRDCETLKDSIMQRIKARPDNDLPDSVPKPEPNGQAELLKAMLQELSAIRTQLEK
ncbi:MAG: PH domain-containing protein [Candidatus Syntrophosphaera sp.]|nr:PH domain-containing protein [Candidatus Syntrophosphaera sp.]